MRKTIFLGLLFTVGSWLGVVYSQDISVDFQGELSGDIGEEVILSIVVSDLTALNISNFDIRFSFDSELIQFSTDNISEGELINSLTANVTDDDRILVSFASSSPISGAGVLFKLTGVITGEGVNESGVVVTELFFGDGTLDVDPELPFDIQVRSGTITSGGSDPTHPNRFNLGSNYPNPFNPTTQIIYSLPLQSTVKVGLYTIEGKKLGVLESGTKIEGEHKLNLNLSGYPSGSYFIRLDAVSLTGERYRETEQITLVK